MAERRLRPVAAGEKAPGQPKTVTQAATSGTKRELLVAMRDRLAKDVENSNTAARDLAALSKRLLEVVNDIEAIDAREREDGSANGDVPDEAFDASAV